MNAADPKALWKAQPTEAPTMSLSQLRLQAGRLQRKVHLRNRTEAIAGSVVILTFGAYLWYFQSVWMRAGSALTIMAVLFVLQQLRWRASARPLPDESLAAACGPFHRAELVRQRDALRTAWAWYLAPFLPGVVLFMGGIASTLADAGALPRIVLALATLVMAATFLGIAWLNRRAARVMDAEIATLDRLVPPDGTDPNATPPSR